MLDRDLIPRAIRDTADLLEEEGFRVSPGRLRQAADEIDQLRDLLRKCRDVGDRDTVRLIDGSGLLE